MSCLTEHAQSVLDRHPALPQLLLLCWCVHVDGFVKPDTLDVRGEVRHAQDGQEVYDDVGGGDEVNK